MALTAGVSGAARARPAERASPAGPTCPSKVMAFHYGWYGGPPSWRHWATATNDPRFAHNPDGPPIATGSQYPGGVRRDISSADYPVLGPYDSHAASVVDRHLAWAAGAGIDALISSWWGPASSSGGYEDQSLGLLLDRIDATGSPVRASAYLETWSLFYGHQFQPDFFGDPRNFSPDSRSAIRAKAVDWISYLLATHGSRPGFLHTRKHGALVPVVFVYTAALFDPVEWGEIFAGVRAKTGTDAFYQADVEGADFQAQARAFDGLHVYTPVPLTAGGALSLVARLRDPQAAMANPAAPVTDPVTVGTDYRAWATEARALGKAWAATVVPGFDDRKVRNPSFVVSRDHGDGRTYDYFWREALRTNPNWVLITSFNEWHEGTEIEPSVEYGSEFLSRTRRWSDRIHRCAPSTDSAGPSR